MLALYKKNTVWSVCFHIVLCGVLFSYTQGVFTTSSSTVSIALNWGSSSATYITLFTTFIPVGALIGALLSGRLMNILGRRKSIMFTDLLIICSSFITILPTTATFGIGRLFSGIAAGLFLTISPVYVNETAPDEMLEKVGPLVQISTIVGIVFAYVMGLPLPTEDDSASALSWWWIVMFLTPAGIALYQLCYFLLVWTHESPLWLLRKGRTDETRAALSMIYTEAGLEIGLKRFSIQLETENDEDIERPREVTYWEIFLSKPLRKMLRVGVLLGVIQQSSGINAAIYYSTKIFTDIGEGDYIARLLTVGTGFVFLASSIVAIPLLSRFGRKPMLISGEMLLCANFFVLALLTSSDSSPISAVVVGVMLVFVFFAYSLGATLWLYLGEVMFEKVLSISNTANLAWDAVVSSTFPVIVEYAGINYAFGLFGVCMIAAAIYCHIDLVETRNRTKPEIHKLMLQT
jgi:sugar porter (SP) family MFS transporter